jgi:hypothetical protein
VERAGIYEGEGVLIAFVKGAFAKALVGKIATDNDTKTTVLGLVAAGLLAGQIDWGKLLNGDSAEIGRAVGCVVTALLGYYTNKADKKTGVGV